MDARQLGKWSLLLRTIETVFHVVRHPPEALFPAAAGEGSRVLLLGVVDDVVRPPLPGQHRRPVVPQVQPKPMSTASC